MSLPGEQKFSCRIEMTKSGGITIVIKDKVKKEQLLRKIVLESADITVTCLDGIKSSKVTMKDESIKTEVTTDKGTTTIDQDGENVNVTCKYFKVDAETVTLNASKAGAFNTGDTCTIKSTKDTTIDSSAGVTVKSVSSMALTSTADTSIKASTNLALEGAQTTMKGSAQLSMSSDGTGAFEAMTVSVKGKTQAAFEAPVTSVGQSMTTVKGQMVEISGALVKLG